ncbi:hypothetical protein DICPUDRAFT_48828 [Dictyostelium purpureum]|uniref:Ras guanine nucleotide exchange factor n=1 Tax=Dictyostelium purpureum TaxID=5786 RepID=F0ZQW5_DICPU|nr:uncharacterized protein DICPUDRAFT_48828 [Dictyostelium purpureum]EGC33639.1 hypothetical protein DICPUDRAFT_48828 [Dictyostelium purpureum]|eukprot:XP_003289809.1 hypothetical protein DICPUDRAFT_48828 [Dictyostelium purpureum]
MNKIQLPHLQSLFSNSNSNTLPSSLPPNKLPPPVPPFRKIPSNLDMMRINKSNSLTNLNEESATSSNTETVSDYGDDDSQLQLSQQNSSFPISPRLRHESKVIPSEITLKVKYQPSPNVSNTNILPINRELMFSPCSTIDEILSNIITNFQCHHGLKNAKHTSDNEWETDAIDIKDHQSFALFHENDVLSPLHKEKTLLELGLKEQQVLLLKTVPLVFTLVKVTMPQFSDEVLPAVATVKFNQFTSIRSVIRKLFLKFHNNIDITKHAIYRVDPSSQREELLDEDELFSTYNINQQSILIFRTLNGQESDLHSSQKTLQLKFIVSTAHFRNNTLNLSFDPRDTVSKAIKITGLRSGLLDSLNNCGFFLTPEDDDDEGFWMDEDFPLENYNLRNNTFLTFKERCKKYTVIVKPGDRKCTFKFDQFTKVSTLFNILVNNEIIKNPKDYYLSIKNGPTLEKHRFVWSYGDIKGDIEFKEFPNKLLLFNPVNGEKNLVYVDFDVPIKDVCARLSQNFTSPIDGVAIVSSSINSQFSSLSGHGSTRERSFTFKKLGHLVNTIDSRKSLRDQGVQPNDALMLQVVDEEIDDQEESNVNSGDTTPSSTPPIPIEDLVQDGTILSEERQINIWDEPADSPENIIYSTTTGSLNPEIDAATLNKLIIRLTNPDFHDLMFMKTFLMTYSSYTTTSTLLKKLFERFQVPQHIDEKERLSAQLRVANVIKYWVEHHYEDFCHESTKLMVDFVDTHMMIAFPTLGIQIRNCILKRTCGFRTELVRTRSNGALTSPRGTNVFSLSNSVISTPTKDSSNSTFSSTPILSRGSSNLSISYNSSVTGSTIIGSPLSNSSVLNSGSNSPSLGPLSPRPISSSASTSSSSLLKSPQPKRIPETKTKGFLNPRTLFDFDDEEIARQLTLYDFQLYSSIKPTEFLNQAWNKPSMAARKSPTILKIIARFNDISAWIVQLILQPDRVKTRAKRLKRIINIADELRKINNFNTCIAFISGINNSAILRLKHTHSLLTKKYVDTLRNLEKEMNCESSYKAYRDKLKNSDPPVVPYIGLYLTDLTFIEEGNPNIIRNNLINFAKYYLIHKVISEIQQYQWTEYQLNVAPIIQTFIRDIPQVNLDELYQLSLLKEPRGSLKSDIP